MAESKGMIVLMGSGELTATMVEVHKELMSRLGDSPRALFLDTPAGFQLNADQLSQRAVQYFRDRVQRSMQVASYKSREQAPSLEAERTFQQLRQRFDSGTVLRCRIFSSGELKPAAASWLPVPLR